MFNGVEFPVEESGLQTLTIHSSVRLFLPTVQLDLMDNQNFFTNQVPIEDGIRIEILIGDNSGDNPKSLKFRIWKWKNANQAGVPLFSIVGYLDAPMYMHQSSNTGMRGTSTAVLEKIANTSGLKFSGSGSNDMQVWLPGNQRYCTFAEQIAKRGYLNDQSFFQLATTLLGEMRYRNLSLLNTNSDVPFFTRSDEKINNRDTYQITDQRHITNSGFANASGGYAHQVVAQAIHRDTESTKKLTIKRLTENFMLNTEVKKQIDRSRVDFAPIDCGNVHPKYEAAAYQNLRSSMLYAFGNEVKIEEQASVDLLELVNYDSFMTDNTGNSKNATFTAAYVVTGKIIHVTTGNYSEVYQMYTTGLNQELVDDGSL